MDVCVCINKKTTKLKKDIQKTQNTLRSFKNLDSLNFDLNFRQVKIDLRSKKDFTSQEPLRLK